MADGWDAKEIFILTIKKCRIVIPYTVSRTGRVKGLTQHQPAGFLKSQLLLEL